MDALNAARGVSATVPRASSQIARARVVPVSTVSRRRPAHRMVVSSSAAAAEVAAPPPAAAGAPALPAIAPDAVRGDFPIAPDRLIALAKAAFATQTGIDDESVLAPDFRFEFPVVSLSREDYLRQVRSFKLNAAIPDLDPHPYGWMVDPYEVNRVWFMIRTTGTHSGSLFFGKSEYKPTGREIRGAPEMCSYVFNAEGKIKAFTGGYVVDRRCGNTGGLGAAFGILTAIGVKVPRPGSLGWTIAVALNKVVTFARGLLSFGRA